MTKKLVNPSGGNKNNALAIVELSPINEVLVATSTRSSAIVLCLCDDMIQEDETDLAREDEECM